MSERKFLNDDELNALIEGRLDGERLEAFKADAAESDDSALLAADVDVMQDLFEHGPTRQEQEEFASLESRAGMPVESTAPAPSAEMRRGGGYRWMAVAALLVVAIGLGVLLRQGGAGPVIELPGGGRVSVVAMPFDAPPTLRGQLDLQEQWQQARAAYDAEEYGDAAAALAEVEALDPEDSDAPLYRGIALLMAGRADEAREALTRSRSLKEELDDPLSAPLWFEALAVLQGDDPDGALELLDRAEASGGAYAEQAAELARSLRDAE
ncbi:hypothetical protein ABI59_10295 [Acidobacteria bacterium Mor1]|nr:hypothetical protein ABI59_10295 [Acidobacteria bacterium Mor1]